MSKSRRETTNYLIVHNIPLPGRGESDHHGHRGGQDADRPPSPHRTRGRLLGLHGDPLRGAALRDVLHAREEARAKEQKATQLHRDVGDAVAGKWRPKAATRPGEPGADESEEVAAESG